MHNLAFLYSPDIIMADHFMRWSHSSPHRTHLFLPFIENVIFKDYILITSKVMLHLA